MFKKFNWGHGVVLMLGSFIIFILLMIVFFPMGKQNAEVVSENYYEEELSYQNVIDAKRNADLLKIRPKYEQNTSNITVTFPQEIQPDEAKINYVLFRTNDSNLDVKKEVLLSSNHSFTIPAKTLEIGSYTFKVKWEADKKPYQIDYDVQWR